MDTQSILDQLEEYCELKEGFKVRRITGEQEAFINECFLSKEPMVKEAARACLIIRFMPFANQIARNTVSSSLKENSLLSEEDLVQECLAHAVELVDGYFDPNKDSKFGSYAYKIVSAAIKQKYWESHDVVNRTDYSFRMFKKISAEMEKLGLDTLDGACDQKKVEKAALKLGIEDIGDAFNQKIISKETLESAHSVRSCVGIMLIAKALCVGPAAVKTNWELIKERDQREEGVLPLDYNSGQSSDEDESGSIIDKIKTDMSAEEEYMANYMEESNGDAVHTLLKLSNRQEEVVLTAVHKYGKKSGIGIAAKELGITKAIAKSILSGAINAKATLVLSTEKLNRNFIAGGDY